MATLQQLKNEASVALAAATALLDTKGAGPEYSAAFAAYESARDAYNARKSIEAEQKMLDDTAEADTSTSEV